tara:strand:+ start:3604 stop:4503 length:900 start_codon:yes stop_codon:yes gene_type:complete
VISFSSIFVGNVKANEICYYSNPKEYKKCKKEDQKATPKFPIENFHSDFYSMGKGIPSIDFSRVGATHKIFEFKAYEKEKLQISTGTKSIGLNGLSWKRPWIQKSTFFINPKQIISIKKTDEYIPAWPRSFIVRKYSFKYIDEYGVVDSIDFQQTLLWTKEKKVYDMIGDYLIYSSNLKWGDEKLSQEVIAKTLRENEKFLVITKNIILKIKNPPKSCFIARESEFPSLTSKYKKLYKTINPLRSKLDLPPSTDLEPICGEPKGSRPLWMEEKIKGCYKYPTQKQRDYCINVYSPYGKE